MKTVTVRAKLLETLFLFRVLSVDYSCSTRLKTITSFYGISKLVRKAETLKPSPPVGWKKNIVHK